MFALVAFAALAGAVYAGRAWDLSKSDWASWVQAVGSIFAILVAVVVVRMQHAYDDRIRSEAERIERKSRLNSLRWLFSIVGEACGSISDMSARKHVVWHLQARVLSERRNLLLSHPVAHYPDGALLLRAQSIAHRLQMAEAVVEALSTPRREETRHHVAELLLNIRDEALVGMTQCTTLLTRICSAEELEREWELMDSEEEARKLATKVWTELLSEAKPRSGDPSNANAGA